MTLPPLPPPPPGMRADQHAQVRAALGLEPRSAPAQPAGEPESVSPGPAVNVPVFENRATQGAAIKDTTAGHNAGSAANAFEERCTQGQL